MENSCYDDMPHITKAGKTVYNAETYTGNWYEETVRNTQKRDEFLMKRECGDLSIQRTQTMVDLLLKPIKLSVSAGPYLHYGDRVQIVAPGPTCRTAIEAYPFKRNYCKLAHLALSATVPPSSIDHAPYLSTDSIISVSPLLFPVVRNSFTIENPDNPSDKSLINYGDVFRVKAFQTQHFPLYLFSAPALRLHVGSTHSAKPKVRFSDIVSADTLWCAHPLDPMEKLRMDLGVPVSMKTRLLIKHNGSGNCLSMESKFPVHTYFGSEYEVTVDSKFDRTKQPSFENMWYFDTDRGFPKTSDPDNEDVEFEKQAELSAKINANDIHRSAIDSAKEEEAAREETDPNDDDNGEQQEQMMMEIQQQMQRQQEMDRSREMMSEMSVTSRGLDGLLAYDPMTAPQPHAYNYRVTEGDPFFPNKKWNCGDTDCCNVRPPLAQTQQSNKCEECPCVEPEAPGFSPNATVNIKRLLM